VRLDRREIETLPPEATPRRLGASDQYELIEPIGSGAMGTVWRARDHLLEIDVAIKVLRTDVDTPQASRRLLAEARAAAQVPHRATVRVYASGLTDAAKPYIVMELLEGISLEQLLDHRGFLPEAEAVKLLLPIVAAAGAAHDAGIVHRDVKPSNIFLAREGRRGTVRPKLLDFGVAKHFRVEEEEALLGIVLGTPSYMAPEQARGRDDIDPRCDVWALSAVLYEILEGEPPFGGTNYNDLVCSILTREVKPLPHVDPGLWAIIARGLDKRRRKRWRDGRELGRALASWLLSAGFELDVTHAAVRHSSMFPPAKATDDPTLAPARLSIEPFWVPVSADPPSSNRRQMKASTQFATTAITAPEAAPWWVGAALGTSLAVAIILSAMVQPARAAAPPLGEHELMCLVDRPG
jgi:eukaryotic-like serine/threonine-protein kinase